MRRALVTGGARGIGEAIAAALREGGAAVVVIDRAADAIAALQREGQAAYVCDVSDFRDVAEKLATIEAEQGPIDILVNNAGITRDAMVHKMDPASQWQAVIDVNLTSAFNTVRVLTPGMRMRGWGRIINISSMSGQRGQVEPVDYAAAKAGLIGFTKSIALELAGRGICANCVAPGFVATSMTAAMPPDALATEASKIPVCRLGQPADVAAAVTFLATEGAGFITGQVIAVNGGQYL